MTMFMKLCSVVLRRNVYVMGILREMLPRFMAEVFHYGIGVLFVVLYYYWRIQNPSMSSSGIVEPALVSSVYGVVAVIAWSLFIRFHPSPPLTVPWDKFLVCIFFAHWIFSFVMVGCFRLIPLLVSSFPVPN